MVGEGKDRGNTEAGRETEGQEGKVTVGKGRGVGGQEMLPGVEYEAGAGRWGGGRPGTAERMGGDGGGLGDHTLRLFGGEGKGRV